MGAMGQVFSRTTDTNVRIGEVSIRAPTTDVPWKTDGPELPKYASTRCRPTPSSSPVYFHSGRFDVIYRHCLAFRTDFATSRNGETAAIPIRGRFIT